MLIIMNKETYKLGSISISEIIDGIHGIGTPMIVPDLQRGYVWSLEQIMALVDTLLKGWPIGQIFWVCLEKQLALSFSPRTFYSQVPLKRFSIHERYYKPINISRYNSAQRLILDGQQRLQSMALVFGNTCGIIMDQKDWIEFLSPGSSYRKWGGKECPYATLYLNLKNLSLQYEDIGNINGLNYTQNNPKPILEWVFQDELDCRWWDKDKLPKMYHELDSTFTPLSKLWDDTKPGKEINIDGYPIEDKNEKEALKLFLSALSQIHRSEIPYIEISEKEAQNELEFNEMVLNIFTRLNRGGTPLAREDITLSWLKRNWNRCNNNSNKCAEDCLRELQRDLRSKYAIDLPLDQIVRSIVSIWGIIDREQKQITNSELMDGVTLRNAAIWISENWNHIHNSFTNIFAMLKKRELRYQSVFYSLSPIIYLSAWLIIGKSWAEKIHMKMTIKSRFFQTFDSELERRLDRFIFAGQWANTWNGQSAYLYLIKVKGSILSMEEPELAQNALLDCLDGVISEMSSLAKENIQDLKASTRAQVSRYRTYLWIWQRLTRKRAQLSKKLASNIDEATEGIPHVDHCISYSWWETSLKEHGQESGIEFESQKYLNALSSINQIGNCCILVNALNASKGKQALLKFLEETLGSEDEKMQEYQNEMSVPDEIMSPSTSKINDISEKLEGRTQKIKSDLILFIDGKLTRE